MRNPMNWQAYLDGSLPSEARREARSLLRKDAVCRQELQALKGFVGQVAAAGRSQPVPTAKFERFFPARKTLPLVHKVALALLPVAVAALLWQTGVFAPFLDRKTEKVSVTADPASAARWASSQLGVALPSVAMKGEATICVVRCGDDWASFSYHVRKERYQLYMTRRGTSDFLARNQLVENSVQWQQKGLNFYLKGPTPETRARLASVAREEIESQSTIPPSLGHCAVP